MQEVEVPNVGIIEFPDEMTGDEIRTALDRKFRRPSGVENIFQGVPKIDSGVPWLEEPMPPSATAPVGSQERLMPEAEEKAAWKERIAQYQAQAKRATSVLQALDLADIPSQANWWMEKSGQLGQELVESALGALEPGLRWTGYRAPNLRSPQTVGEEVISEAAKQGGELVPQLAMAEMMPGALPAALRYGSVFGGTTLARTGEVGPAAISAATAALVPSVGSASRGLAADVMAGLARRGLMSSQAQRVQKVMETMAELGGIQLFLEGVNLPEYRMMTPEQRNKAIATSLLVNTAWAVPGLKRAMTPGLASETQARIGDPRVQAAAEVLKDFVSRPEDVNVVRQEIDNWILENAKRVEVQPTKGPEYAIPKREAEKVPVEVPPGDRRAVGAQVREQTAAEEKGPAEEGRPGEEVLLGAEEVGNAYAESDVVIEEAGGTKQWRRKRAKEQGVTVEELYEKDKTAKDKQKQTFRDGLEEGDVLEVTGDDLMVDPETKTVNRVTTTKRYKVKSEDGRLYAESETGGASYGLEPDSGSHFFNALNAPTTAAGVLGRKLKVVKKSGVEEPTQPSGTVAPGEPQAVTPAAPTLISGIGTVPVATDAEMKAWVAEGANKPKSKPKKVTITSQQETVSSVDALKDRFSTLLTDTEATVEQWDALLADAAKVKEQAQGIRGKPYAEHFHDDLEAFLDSVAKVHYAEEGGKSQAAQESRAIAERLLGKDEPAAQPPAAKAPEPAAQSAKQEGRYRWSIPKGGTDAVIETPAGNLKVRAIIQETKDGGYSVEELTAFVPPHILSADIAPRQDIKITKPITGKTKSEVSKKAYAAFTDMLNQGGFDVLKSGKESALPAPVKEAGLPVSREKELVSLPRPPRTIGELSNAELEQYLSKLAFEENGRYRLEQIYAENVGENAPESTGELVDFFVQHYRDYPEDFAKDFPQAVDSGKSLPTTQMKPKALSVPKPSPIALSSKTLSALKQSGYVVLKSNEVDTSGRRILAWRFNDGTVVGDVNSKIHGELAEDIGPKFKKHLSKKDYEEWGITPIAEAGFIDTDGKFYTNKEMETRTGLTRGEIKAAPAAPAPAKPEVTAAKTWRRTPEYVAADDAVQAAFEKLGAAEKGAFDKSKRKGMTKGQLAKLAQFDKLVDARNAIKEAQQSTPPKPEPPAPGEPTSPGPGAARAGQVGLDTAIQQLNDYIKGLHQARVQAQRQLPLPQRFAQALANAKNLPARMKLAMADRLAQFLGRGRTVPQRIGLQLAALRASLAETARGVRSATDLGRKVGELDYVLQKSSALGIRLKHTLIKDIPDPIMRSGLWIYADAGGDINAINHALANLPADTPMSVRRALRAATQLSPAAMDWLPFIEQFYGIRAQEGLDAGVLTHVLEDYFTHVWKTKDDMPPSLQGAFNKGAVNEYFQFARQRKLSTLLLGIMDPNIAPGKRIAPVLDPAQILPYYNYALDRAIASREFIKSLSDINASDGRPLVAPSGMRKELTGQAGAGTLLIRPRVKPEDSRDYHSIDHPALRQWRWAGTDENGNTILYEGNLDVHPEAFERLVRMLDRSRLTPSPLTRKALRYSGQIKAAKLGMLSTFHLVHVGKHAVFHLVNPFTAARKPIDWDDPFTRFAVEQGHLKLAPEPGEIEALSEGLGATGDMLIHKIPLLGPVSKAFSEWMFQEYIPRLKLATFKAAYERNLKWYGPNRTLYKKITSMGAKTLTNEEIAARTGDAVNAAYGELNKYWLGKFGRNPTTQRFLRLLFLAPDFGEARLRFVGKAATVYGNEERMALFLNFALLYTAARLGNWLVSGNPESEDPKHMFEVKIGKHWVSMRSVVADLSHAFSDFPQFMRVRLNPGLMAPLIEFLSRTNQRGQPVDAMGQIRDLLYTAVPIPMQGLTQSDRHVWESILQSLGAGARRGDPVTEVHQMARDWKKARGIESPVVIHESPVGNPYREARVAMEFDDEARFWAALGEQYKRLRLTNTRDPEKVIEQAFARYYAMPFTGRKATEDAFKTELSPAHRLIYKEALKQQQESWRKFQRWWRDGRQNLRAYAQ